MQVGSVVIFSSDVEDPWRQSSAPHCLHLILRGPFSPPQCLQISIRFPPLPGPTLTPSRGSDGAGSVGTPGCLRAAVSVFLRADALIDTDAEPLLSLVADEAEVACANAVSLLCSES